MSAPVVVSTPAAVPSMTVEACSRMVEAATHSCAAAPVGQPNWDAMANSFASLSTAIAVAGVLLTFIFFFGGLAWGKYIGREAKEEARQCVEEWLKKEAPKVAREEARVHAKEAALKEAKQQFTTFMAVELPQVVSQFESKLEYLTLNGGVTDADAIGKNAGDEDS